jgi:hypothetical protein
VRLSYRDAQALLLGKSGIYELEGFDSSDLDNYEERSSTKISQPPLQHAHQRAVGGDYDAHEALLEIIRLSVERIARPPEDNKVLELRESLLSDGYELQFDPAGTRKCQLLPIDPDGIPVRAEIAALEAELDQRGYDEAKEHYLSAVRHFTEQVHSSANGQLRNMVESLVKNLAIDHAGYVDTGKANQGSQAIKNCTSRVAARLRQSGIHFWSVMAVGCCKVSGTSYTPMARIPVCPMQTRHALECNCAQRLHGSCSSIFRKNQRACEAES